MLPRLAPDRQHVYFIGFAAAGNIYKYDLAAQQVVAIAPLESDRALAISPDGEALYQVRNAPGPDSPSAELLEYDGALGLRDRIALPNVDGAAPIVLDAPAVSPDGQRVYVAAGTGSIVPLIGGPQPGWLIAVDPAAEKALWTKPLGIWAPAQLFVR